MARYDDDDDFGTDEQPEAEPNLPVVPVRGITEGDLMMLYERYNLDFTPPTYHERKLGEVIIALEELVMDFQRREQSRRTS